MEKDKDNEKVYTIPLRDAWKGAYKYRAKKSMYVIREFVKRHTKTENVRIGQELNHEIWENGRKNPPRRVKVQVVSHDGAMWVELQGVKINFPKKKDEKKEESKKEATPSEKATETKKEKVEAPKEKEPKQDKKETPEHKAKAPEEKKSDAKKGTESQAKLKKDTAEPKAGKPSKKSPSTKAKATE